MHEEKLTTTEEAIITFETDEITPNEREAYETLKTLGHAIIVKSVDSAARANGKSSLDMTIGGLSWELKSPTGSNPKKTITGNLNKAIQRCDNSLPRASAVRIVLTCLETVCPGETSSSGSGVK